MFYRGSTHWFPEFAVCCGQSLISSTFVKSSISNEIYLIKSMDLIYLVAQMNYAW